MTTNKTDEQQNKLTGTIDGAFELLDRQLIDVEGRMLGKVDDVELMQTDEGLAITALLTGQVALLHRLGGGMGDSLAASYVRLRPAETNRSRPWRIPIEDVDRLDSAVHLRVHRDESLTRDVESFRLGTITGMTVLEPEAKSAGRVLDARFAPAPSGRLVLKGLVVGRGHAGSLLGYDRWPGMGPWLVRAVVGWWHRHTRVIDVEHVQILWNNEEVHLDAPVADLGRSPLRT